MSKHAHNFIDLAGQRFGSLTVVKFVGVDSGKQVKWECLCDCGTVITRSTEGVKKNKNKSCGCIREKIIYKTKHGLYGKRIYNIWKTMHSRCERENDISYKYYGAKGVTVCPEWSDVEVFSDWANINGYSDTLTLDRIDNAVRYEPNNCRWSTMLEQENNRSDNRLLEYNGEADTLSNLCRKYNKNYSTMQYRLRIGWAVDRAFSEPLMRIRLK